MSKRPLAPKKNKARLAKRAKVTGIKSFFSVAPTSSHPQPTSVSSPAESASSSNSDLSDSTNGDFRSDSDTGTPDIPIIASSSITLSSDSDSEPLQDSGSIDTATPNQLPRKKSKNTSTEPCHPNVRVVQIPPKRTKNQNVFFQQRWFVEYPWLTYNSSLKAVLCHHCYRAHSMGMLNLVKKSEEAFTVHGFRNWKKGAERFKAHLRTDCHKHAVSVLKSQEQPNISVQLNHEEEAKQKERRRCMLKVIRKIRILLRQGLAFRSNPETEGNLYQFLHEDAEDDPGLAAYLKHNTNYTSWLIQREFCSAFSNAILRRIAQVC